ncbi:MAG: hypothetical protein ACM65K_12805 [Microcoleus sp.]
MNFVVSILQKLRKTQLLEAFFWEGNCLPLLSNQPQGEKPAETKIQGGFDRTAKMCLINADGNCPAKLILPVQYSTATNSI